MALDVAYRLRIPHRAGQLATVAGTIAEQEGLIGDVSTLAVTRETSVRELTVEVAHPEHAARVSAALERLDGVEVLWHGDRALRAHEGGKLTVEPVRRVQTVQDVRDVYTPGVARACLALVHDPELARRYTMIGRTVAVITNGTRVLGLGNIGPLAAMPVMEGKALFYRQYAGISAMPILLDAPDADSFVEAVLRIAPTFGGIHLEDIAAPECFEIEARLIEALPVPVMHDDVHGTAVVALGALIAGCRRTGLELRDATVGQLGLGAAGFGIASLVVSHGVRRVLAADPDEAKHARAQKAGIEVTDADRVLREADVLIATTGRPDSIAPEQIRKGSIVLALSNPDAEIAPEAALRAGAAFAADGSMVNNVVGYPGIFRGALLAGAREINAPMKLAAAQAIAELALQAELVPDPLQPETHERVTEAVRAAAVGSGAGREGVAPAGL